MSITRRRFLEDSLLAAAALSPAAALAQAMGQPGAPAVQTVKNPIRVAVIGVRGRGRAHIKSFKDSPDSEVVAICDPDEGVIGPAMEAVPDADFVRDVRRLLERKDIDAVSIATPNHWHSLATVWALHAGKHVYVEKPISHDLGQGRVVYDTAKRSGLVVQHGTQARSHKATLDAIGWLRSGAMGGVRLASALCYKRRESLGRVAGPVAPPPTCDFDLWTGPARKQPVLRGQFHYDWHWDYNTGNGDIGNQGVHQMDIARWGLGQDGFPTHVTSCGGRLGYDDDGNTANTQIAFYEYDDAKIIFEVRGLETPDYKGARVGVVFHCERGYLVSANYSQVHAYDHDGNLIRVFEGGGNHVQNFLNAVHAGTPANLTAPAWDGHVSSGMCHLGNVSYLLGSSRKLASGESPFAGDADANESFGRFREHLVANGLDAARTDYRMGPRLEFNAQTEQFVGSGPTDVANRLLHQEHRAGFGFNDFA